MTTKFINTQYQHSDITSKIINCSMEVHSFLGSGFQEVIYQRALQYEFYLQDIFSRREVKMDIHYKDKFIGRRRVDFYVEEKVMVEIKAVSELEPIHLAQAINYLEIYNLEVGMLINFGGKSLQYRRLSVLSTPCTVF